MAEPYFSMFEEVFLTVDGKQVRTFFGGTFRSFKTKQIFYLFEDDQAHVFMRAESAFMPRKKITLAKTEGMQ